MLVELALNGELFSLQSVNWDEPPEDVSVAENIDQLVKVALLLELLQLFVSDLFVQVKLDLKIVHPPLQVVHEAPVRLDLVEHVVELAEAEEAHEESGQADEEDDDRVEPENEAQALD